MKTNAVARLPKFLRLALLAAAVSYIITYLVIALLRIRYPFELEWVEGGSLDQVRRILSGQKLYVSPSLEFVPAVYTPLYYYVSALVSKIVGIGFTPLRLVSFISSLGSFLVIFLIVKRDTRSTFSGILAAGLFAATFRIGGAWFDVARVDSLYLFLLLAALYLIRFNPSSKAYVLAGVLISLSFLTKQTALLIALPVMLYAVLANRRYAAFLIGSVVAIIGVSSLYLNHIHGGWYKFYTLDLVRQHGILRGVLASFWTKDIMSPLSIASIMSMLYIFTQILNSERKICLFYFLTAIGMLTGAWYSRLGPGGYDNTLLPAYAVISILFGLATHTTLEVTKAASGERRRILESYVYVVCIIQFALLAYNPLRQVPTRDDLEAGNALVNAIREIEGEVFVPFHSYLPVLAGKNGYADAAAIAELKADFGGVKLEAGTRFLDEMRQAIRQERFDTIILDQQKWFTEEIEDRYAMQQRVFGNKSVFLPVTGWSTRPEFIYLAKSHQNLLINGDFETWDAGTAAADGWERKASSSIARVSDETFGKYSLSLANADGEEWYLKQSVPGYAEYRDHSVTFQSWVKSAEGDRQRLRIYDGRTWSDSPSHSGSGEWERLSVTKHVAPDATELTVYSYVSEGEMSAALFSEPLLLDREPAIRSEAVKGEAAN